MQGIVPVIFILIFIVAPLIKRALEKLAEQAGEQGDIGAEEGFEARPDEIRAFLESLQRAQRPPVRVGPAQAGPPGVPVQQPEEDMTVRLVADAEDVLERPGTIPAVPAPVSAAQPARTARRRRRSPGTRTRARTVEEPAQAGAAAGAGLVPPLALQQFGLRQAVVWSEILGKPVSQRGARRGPPVRRGGL